jgi:PEP-CTERM motif
MVNIGRPLNKLAALILSTAILATLIGVIGPGPAGATPVTWSFYETAITSCDNPGSCALPPQPYVLMTLALPGLTSNGTATWLGTVNQPVYTGDSFTLTTRASFMRPLTPAFMGGASNPSRSACANGGDICDFNISWSETAGQLTAVDINIDLVSDNIGGMAGRGACGLTGGPIASDGTLGGCGFTQCQIAGFWQSDLSVPEPTSSALLASGLFGTWLGRRRRTGRARNREGWQVGRCNRFLCRTTGLRARTGWSLTIPHSGCDTA